MRVVWSLGAQEDAQTIVLALTEKSVAAAERMSEEFALAAERLSDFPQLGIRVDDAGRRHLLIAGGRYRLSYRISSDVRTILGISLAPSPWPSDRS